MNENTYPDLTRQWTVATWNINGAAKPNLEQIASVLRATDSDVIALQEVRWRQAHKLAKLLNMKVVWRRKHFPYTVALPHLAEGLAILSPHRIKHERRITLTPNQSINNYKHRTALSAEIKCSAGKMRVVNIHLMPHDLRDEREHEAIFLTGYLAALSELTTTIVGDFNSSSDENVVPVLCGDQRIDSWPAVRLGEAGHTNPSANPYQRLDHILIPKDANNLSCVLPFGGDMWAELSDHLPLATTFTL